MKTLPFSPVWSSGQVLRGVEIWAPFAYLLRETAAIPNGRIDGLLIPINWASPLKPGIHGVEVKVHRSDFLRGLREGQYERYAEQCSSLYLATGYGVCKTSEVPKGIGHLVVGLRDGEPVCVCKRHAVRTKAQVTNETMWRVLFDLFDQFSRERRDHQEAFRRSHERAGECVWGPIARILDKARKQIDQMHTKELEQLYDRRAAERDQEA